LVVPTLSDQGQRAGVTFGHGAFDVELVALRPRQVDHDTRHRGPAPRIVRSKEATVDAEYVGAAPVVLVAVVAGANLVQSTRDLRGAPSLVDTERTDDVGNGLRREVGRY